MFSMYQALRKKCFLLNNLTSRKGNFDYEWLMCFKKCMWPSYCYMQCGHRSLQIKCYKQRNHTFYCNFSYNYYQ